MSVAHDSSSEAHTGTTGSASAASFSWTHTPVGTPRGVLVFTYVNANADNATAVSYGGVAMTAVTGGRAIDSAGEPRDCKAWFLGAGIPTGAQTVLVTRTNNANVMTAQAVTVTAGGDTCVHEAGVAVVQGDGTLAEQAVTDGSIGIGNSLRYAGVNSAINAVPSAGANSTVLQSIDFGNNICALARENTAGTGSRSIGFADANSDDRAYVALAIRELASFPTAAILDDFNRANEGPPASANWTALDSGWTVSSNQAAPVDNVGNAEYWNAATFGADFEAYVTIATKPADGLVSYIGAVRNGTANGYAWLVTTAAGTDSLSFTRLDAGAGTLIGASISLELSAGDRLGWRVRGSIHELWVYQSGAWRLIGQRSEATYTGNTDFRVLHVTSSSAARHDDVGGGNYIAPGGGGGAARRRRLLAA